MSRLARWSRRNVALWRKDWRELAASRATLVVLVLLGPLVGQAFITAVDTYAEVSGIAGGPAALAQGLSPLDGLVVPMMGAYVVVATLLCPFVAIRLISAEKESGALALLLQSPVSIAGQVLLKFVALCSAWLVALLPALIGLALWHWYGGHLDASEVFAVFAGYMLRGALVSAVALAAASIADNAASAAVIALAVTIGAWALDFIGQVKGGALLAASRFTPDVALRAFDHAEARLDVVLVLLVSVAMLLAIAVVWLHPGRTPRTRVVATSIVVVTAAVLMPLVARTRASWDLSEDHRGSFAPADARALASIVTPLQIEAHLAPEDPRLTDLTRGVWHKLARTMRAMYVTTMSRTSTGLFEPADGHYGEVWYALGARRTMSRSSTEPIVLETIYGLAGMQPPAPDVVEPYPGYPLAARPRWAAFIFYACWPIATILLWWRSRRLPR